MCDARNRSSARGQKERRVPGTSIDSTRKPCTACVIRPAGSPVKSRKEVDLSRITKTTPVGLTLAAELAFPDGSVTAATLTREIAVGRLTAWRVGNKLLTSQTEVTKWLDQCRVDASQERSGPLGAPPQGRPTEAYLAASQAHLMLQLERIKEEARAKKKEARAQRARSSTRRQT